MADDDDEMDGGEEFDEELEEEEQEPEELSEDDLDEDALADEDEFGEIDEEFDADAEGDEDEDDDADLDGPVRKSVTVEEDDDDDDILAPDDVEADLDTILKDRLVATDDEAGEDEDEEPEDRTETSDRLQPKRADEQLCPRCFLLVRNSAPICPVGDDDCPLFGSH